MREDEILIEGLELPVRIGVPETERETWQVLRADITLRSARSFEEAHDDLSLTIDYAAAAERFRALAACRPRQLIETLAAELAQEAIQSLGAVWVKVELRKRILPGADAVGVRLVRHAKGMEEMLVD